MTTQIYQHTEEKTVFDLLFFSPEFRHITQSILPRLYPAWKLSVLLAKLYTYRARQNTKILDILVKLSYSPNPQIGGHDSLLRLCACCHFYEDLDYFCCCCGVNICPNCYLGNGPFCVGRVCIIYAEDEKNSVLCDDELRKKYFKKKCKQPLLTSKNISKSTKPNRDKDRLNGKRNDMNSTLHDSQTRWDGDIKRARDEKTYSNNLSLTNSKTSPTQQSTTELNGNRV